MYNRGTDRQLGRGIYCTFYNRGTDRQLGRGIYKRGIYRQLHGGGSYNRGADKQLGSETGAHYFLSI